LERPPPQNSADTGEFKPIPANPTAAEPARPASLLWIHGLSGIAMLFLAVAIANIVLLVLAVAFVDGPATLSR